MHEFEELIVWLDKESVKIPVKRSVQKSKLRNDFN